jgi:hypothetical protein
LHIIKCKINTKINKLKLKSELESLRKVGIVDK